MTTDTADRSPTVEERLMELLLTTTLTECEARRELGLDQPELAATRPDSSP